MHQSNNVVARCGELVFKVSPRLEMAERDAVVAAHAAARGGPALAPVGDLVEEEGLRVGVAVLARSPTRHAGWIVPNDSRGASLRSIRSDSSSERSCRIPGDLWRA